MMPARPPAMPIRQTGSGRSWDRACPAADSPARVLGIHHTFRVLSLK